MSEPNVEISIRARDLTKQAFASISAAMKEMDAQSEKSTQKSAGMLASVKGFFTQNVDGGKMASMALAGVAAGIVAVGAATVALGMRGADVQDVRDHFDKLNTAIGNNAQTMLGTLQAATGKTISNFDLMKTANLALSDGVKLSEANFATLGQAARVLADRTGGDTKTAFESMTQAMATGKTMGLAAIGVTIDQEKAVDAYAKSVKKSTKDLTDQEVKLAKQQALLGALETMLGQTGLAQDDFADAIARGQTFFANLNDDLAVGIANSPVFGAALGGVQQAMDNAFGGDSQGMVKQIVSILESAAIRAIDFAQAGIWTAGVLGQAFSAVQGVFHLVAAGLLDMAATAATAIGGAAELASKLPGVGDTMRGVAQGAKDAAVNLGGMRDSFKSQAAEAWEGVKGNSAWQKTLDGASTGLSTMRDAMVKAQGAKADDTAATNTNSGALRSNGAALADNATQSKAAAAAALKHREEIKKLGDALSGATIFEALGKTREALKGIGGDLTKLPLDSLERINKEINAAIGIYQARGQAVPQALLAEAVVLQGLINKQRELNAERERANRPQMIGPGIISKPGAQTIGAFGGGPQMIGPEIISVSTTIRDQALKAFADKKPGMLEQMFGSKADIGNYFQSSFGDLSGMLSSVISGGMGIGTAVKGYATNVAKDFAGTMLSFIPGIGPLLSQFAGPMIDGLKKMIGGLFGTAGRDTKLDLAKQAFGSVEEMQKQMLTLGEDYHRLWKQFSEVGQNNKGQAVAALDAITSALDAQKKKQEEVSAAAAKTAEAQGAALTAIAEKHKAVIDKLKGELESFSAALADEADSPEYDEMGNRIYGVEEMRMMKRKEALEQEIKNTEEARDAEIEAKKETFDALLSEGSAVNDALRDLFGQPFKLRGEWDIPDPRGGGSGEPSTGHARGAYIRQDHVARVHAGEIIGPADFMTRALSQALLVTGGAGGRGESQTIVLKIGEREVARANIKTQGRELARLGVR